MSTTHNYNGKWPDSIGEELVGDAPCRLLIITMGNGPTLLGRNWLEMLHVDYS